MKFGRIFSMYAEGKLGSHIIQSPLTCKFRASSTGTPSANLAAFVLYNLTPEVRNDLFKDSFEQFIYKQLVFSAGYEFTGSVQSGIKLPIIFRGNINRCFSYRQGPDWLTEIECYDGGYGVQNGNINLSVPAPKSNSATFDFKDVVTNIVAGMPRVKLGLLGNFSLVRSRGLTFCGNPWDILVRRILPLEGKIYIDQEEVFVLQQREYVVSEGTIDTISEETGLLDTPRKQNALIKCRMIFEPRIEMMQRIEVKSLVPGLNGHYIVQGIEHGGTISGAECGSLITTVTGFGPEERLVAVGG